MKMKVILSWARVNICPPQLIAGVLTEGGQSK